MVDRHVHGDEAMTRTERPQSIERVLFNPKNGKLAVGFRLRFMDKYHSEEIASLEGYSVTLEPNECDAWAIDNENGIFLVVHTGLMDGIEDWGPL